MSTAPRIAVPPPRAPRARVARAARPPRRAPARVRARARPSLRGLASGLLGALAGLAAGAGVVAGAPVVGRPVGPDATAITARAGAAGEVAFPVSAVLSPAIDAGVVSSPDPEAARP